MRNLQVVAPRGSVTHELAQEQRRERLTLYLFAWELESMPEYSTTLPTGTTVGKLWKRNLNVHHRRAEPRWLVCMYGPDSDPKMVAIWHAEVVLRHGPAPRVYRPPDWSYYEGWKLERAAERAKGAR